MVTVWDSYHTHFSVAGAASLVGWISPLWSLQTLVLAFSTPLRQVCHFCLFFAASS